MKANLVQIQRCRSPSIVVIPVHVQHLHLETFRCQGWQPVVLHE